MNVFEKLIKKYIFGYNYNSEEDDYIEEIAEHNQQEQEPVEFTKEIKVVQYLSSIYSPNPNIYVICDFHGDVIPEKGSIIWAHNKEHNALVPYYVDRVDFIEDENNMVPVSHTTLIVVKTS